VAFRALTPAAMLAISMLALAQSQRWPDALRAADAQSDPLARSRARVEVFYAAGDLPGALREAHTGLGVAREDPILLRRACQLSTALRIPELAEEYAGRLAHSVAMGDPDPVKGGWWRGEANALEREVRELTRREGQLERAARRARATSLGVLGALFLALIALARTR
jgi:hypothetical protein